MLLENPFDDPAEFKVCFLAGSRLGGVVVAAAGNSKHLANGADAVPCFLMDVCDHRA
jgi:hypothetical protein